MSKLPDGPTTPGAPLLPEERVHAALRRAAQLQAEAAERLEGDVRARIAPRGGDGGEPGGFRREDVEAAAVQVGISPEYIRQALVEQETLGEHAADLAPWMERMASRMLRTRQRGIELSRTIAAEPRVVLEAMQRVFPAQPYGLMLVDCVGPAPLEGGVLVFQVPQMSMFSTGGYTAFSYIATAVDLLQLHATLRPAPGGCTVTLRGDLRTSARRNVWAGLGLSGVGGGVGALLGGFVAGVASGGALPLLAVGAALGAAGFGGAGAAGYGAMYRYYLRKMMAELETLLRVVDTNARTGGSFGLPQPPAGQSGADVLGQLFGSS